MQLTDYQRQVLGAMRPKPISLGGLKRAIGYPGSERALRQLLMRMADKGLIERTGDWGYIATVLGRHHLWRQVSSGNMNLGGAG